MSKGDNVQQARTPADREFDDAHNMFVAQMHGEARVEGGVLRPAVGKDMAFEVSLPFGQAKYRLSSLTQIGSSGIFIPGHVEVDFSLDSGAPIRTMTLVVQQGVPMCSEVRIVGRTGSRGLRAADLEAIEVADWTEDILSECTWQIDNSGMRISRPGSKEGRKAIQEAMKADRRQISRELLAAVAAVYTQHVAAKPIEAIQEEFGLAYRTAARYVQMCRSDEYQLLPKTQRGQRKA